jgi:hypothetical protein
MLVLNTVLNKRTARVYAVVKQGEKYGEKYLSLLA